MNYVVIFERISKPETIEQYVTANSYWEDETEAQTIIYEHDDDIELVHIEALME